jgi:hypothetical protein
MQGQTGRRQTRFGATVGALHMSCPFHRHDATVSDPTEAARTAPPVIAVFVPEGAVVDPFILHLYAPLSRKSGP